jgi:membrane-bound ClpP family serine protease
MILNSRGGQTEVPANLVPLIRNYCNHFGVIIPYRAHSAATHLAIGANEIVMGPMSELGPVDPSRSHPLLPKDKDGNPIPISVQDLKHVVDLLKREGPAENYTPEALATIFSTMFQYIHPLAMGAIEQSYALAKSISIKLLSTHMDPENEKDRIEHIANALSDSFKSHLYQISWKEAKALGLPILYDNGEIYQQAWQLYEMIIQKLNNPPANPTGAKIVSHPIMVIGTEKSKYVLFELSEVIPEGALTKFKPLGANWISSNTLDAKKAEETVPTAEKS